MRFPRLSANGWLLVVSAVILAGLAGEPAYRAMTGKKSAAQIRMEKAQDAAAKMAEGPKVGDPAPPFTLKAYKEKRDVSLADFSGRPVLVNFYCGCYLCRDVATEFEKVLKKPLKHQPEVVNIYNFSEDRLDPFLKDTGVTSGIHLHDPGKKVGYQWGSSVCPRTWVVDEQGRIAYRHETFEGERRPSPVPAKVRALLNQPKPLLTASR